ncbi:MAG TPA: hypothetical protein ENI33_09080 [Thermoplasmatales archaeon]|nr:hypothetical protein [Thermoplasmatales archaeon]
MIGLLTSNFTLYHDVIDILRRREIPFFSLDFSSKIPPEIDIVITSEEDADAIDFDKKIVCRENCNLETLIDKAEMMCYGENIKIIFGIDPGDNIGIAIFGNEKFIRSFVAKSPEQASEFIKEYIEEMDANEVIVRIGNGARLVRNRIINFLINENLKIEIVDESTIPCMDDDAMDAFKIAMAKGNEIKRGFSVEPKEGEIREMQRLSRIKSKNITISKKLAKKVLTGEIALEDAIEMQKNKNQE